MKNKREQKNIYIQSIAIKLYFNNSNNSIQSYIDHTADRTPTLMVLLNLS